MADVEVVGSPEVVKVIARGPAGPGGGGAVAENWAVIALATPAPLTVSNFIYVYLAADLSIVAQSGSDFSIGDDPGGGGSGAIISAAGGGFQFGGYVGVMGNATLDGGSTAQRYVWMGATLGDTADVVELGLDYMVPVFASSPFGGVCCASLPGYATPGGPAAFSIEAGLVNGFGTDSVPLSSIYHFMVWQVSA